MRKAAESVLRPDETLSSFVEESLRSQIAYRVAEEDFVARGLRAAEEARETGVYHSADSVLREMTEKLRSAKSETKKPSGPARRKRTSRR